MLKSLKRPSSRYYGSGRIDINTRINQPAGQPTRASDWKKILPGVIISLVCLTLVLYFALRDPQRFIDALRLADYRLVLLFVGSNFVWIGVRAMVWRTLLRGQAPYWQVFLKINEGYLLNNILPFRLGEIGRAFLLSRKINLEFWKVFSTIFVERILDLAMAACLLLSTLSFVVGASWAREALLGTLALVGIGLGGLYVLARSRQQSLQLLDRLANRWLRIKQISVRISQRLDHFLDGLSVLTDPKRFLLVLFWVIVNWGVAIAQYYCLMLAFFPGGKLLWSSFTLAIAALGLAAPASPGSLGVYELSVVGAFSVFGLDVSIALALAITGHVIQYVITGLIGAWGLAQDGESLLGLFNRIRKL